MSLDGEISIFNPQFTHLSIFDIQFASLSIFNLIHANSFNSRDYGGFLLFLIPKYFLSLLRAREKTKTPLPPYLLPEPNARSCFCSSSRQEAVRGRRRRPLAATRPGPSACQDPSRPPPLPGRRLRSVATAAATAQLKRRTSPSWRSSSHADYQSNHSIVIWTRAIRSR
jgi:hypothetical protein